MAAVGTGAASVRSASTSLPKADARMVLAIACVAQFMGVLDVSIVNVALPAMARSLRLGPTGLQWVVNAYALPFAGLLLFGGRAADLLGHKRVFLSGIGLFVTGSLFGGLAQSAAWIIAARAAQGVGGAVLAPSTLSLLTTTFTEPDARARAMGIWSATSGSAGAFGVLAGGVLTGLEGWRWVLFVNVPIGVAIFVAARLRLAGDGARGAVRRDLDLAGTVTAVAAMTLLTYGLAGASHAGWASPHTVGFVAAAVACAVGFVVVEARSRRPLVPLGIFADRSLALANAVAVLVGAAMLAAFFFVSLDLQFVLGFGALGAGVGMLPLACCIIAGANLAGHAVARAGPRPVLVSGTVCAAVGLAWLSRTVTGAGYAGGVLPPSLLLGLGIGLSMVPMTIAALSALGRSQQGLGSGVLTTSRQFGAAVGLAVLTTFATAHAAGLAGPGGRAAAQAVRQATGAGYGRALLLAAFAMGLAAVLAAALPAGAPAPPGRGRPRVRP